MSFSVPRTLDKDLYGPTRISAKTDIKDILLGDHVLQEGEWCPENVQHKPWTTSFSISFQEPRPRGNDRNEKKSSPQTNVTNFVLGSEWNPCQATTSKDFDKKHQGAPIKAAPDQSTSIPDFVPKFMVDKTFGKKSGSVYGRSFAKNGNLETSSAKNRAQCKWHSNDRNAAHFQFGTDPNGYGTETTHSFKPVYGRTPGATASTNLSSGTALEAYKSSVFRNGDWNVAEPGLVRHSVTCSDFHIKPFAGATSSLHPSGNDQRVQEEDTEEDTTETSTVRPQDDPFHPHYQQSTLFVLGSSKQDRSSIYYNDFMLGERQCLFKPRPAPPPISSKVLPSPQGCFGQCSTNMADFVDHKNHIKGISQERDVEARFNRDRHNTQAVMLTCDPRRHTGDRQASMTGDSYWHPANGIEYLSPRGAPRSKYRYLDSDGALLKAPQWPSSSETQEEFVPIGELVTNGGRAQLTDKRFECAGRIQDSRTTHFQFGSDSETRHSEQHDQFSKTIRVDPSLAAAGKSEGQEQKYSHVFPTESAEQISKNVSRSSGPRDQVTSIQDHIQRLNQQRFCEPRDPMNINLRKAFLEFDTSLSGKISKENLRTALNNLGVEMDNQAFERLFEICDADHSGYVDYQNFAKHLTKSFALREGTKPTGESVMRADYDPPDRRGFTSAQLRTIEMCKRINPVAVSSHYFHKHHTGAPRFSTTAQDFIRPDRLPGRAITAFKYVRFIFAPGGRGRNSASFCALRLAVQR